MQCKVTTTDSVGIKVSKSCQAQTTGHIAPVSRADLCYLYPYMCLIFALRAAVLYFCKK